jgi:hypothetical protein
MVFNHGYNEGKRLHTQDGGGVGRVRQRGPRNTLGGYIHWRGRFSGGTRSRKALDQEASSEGGSVGGKKRPRLPHASNTKKSACNCKQINPFLLSSTTPHSSY